MARTVLNGVLKQLASVPIGDLPEDIGVHEKKIDFKRNRRDLGVV